MESEDLSQNFKRTGMTNIHLTVTYLQQLVARQEVRGWLENGCHGFGQLLVNCFHIGGGIRLWLEYKLPAERQKIASV